LTGPELGRAEAKRTELYHRVRQFMETYEFLILPVNQVPPFDLKQRYVTEINGVKMGTYMDWMKSCYYISVTGHPAISVPCGFTPEGLPWVYRWWADIRTILAYSSSLTRLNRPQNSGKDGLQRRTNRQAVPTRGRSTVKSEAPRPQGGASGKGRI